MYKLFNRRNFGAAIVAAVTLLIAPATLAQSSNVLRLIPASTPGSGLDVLSRLLADGLQKELAQTVIVDPKPGAGGALAVNDMLKAPRDGNTVVISLDSMVSEIPHIVKLNFDMAKEVKPLAELARNGLVMIGHPSVPAKNLAEVIAYVKANQGKVSYASYSAGTASHILGLQLNKAANIDMVHVPYRGAPPALLDVMGGHVPLSFLAIANILPHVKTGKVVPYAVSLSQRSPLLPNVPTFAELGYPTLASVLSVQLFIAPDVPAAAQTRLREAVLKIMAQPAARERLAELGFDPAQPRTPDELAKKLRVDYELMGELLKSINFKAD